MVIPSQPLPTLQLPTTLFLQTFRKYVSMPGSVRFLLCVLLSLFFQFLFPQWGAADAEFEVPSGENTELKRSPFKAWNTCYAYCQGFLSCLFLPFRSIYLRCFFFFYLCRYLLGWLWLTHGSCVGPQNKTDHPPGCRFPC